MQLSAEDPIQAVNGVDVEFDIAVGMCDRSFATPSKTAEESVGFAVAVVTVVSAAIAVAAASVGNPRCSVEVSQPPVKSFLDLPNPFVIQHCHRVGRIAAVNTVAVHIEVGNTAAANIEAANTAAGSIVAGSIVAGNTAVANTAVGRTAVGRIVASSHSCHWSRRDFGPFGYQPHDRLLRRSDRQR